MIDIAKYVDAKHFPVMICEVLEFLNIRDNGIYVDATFGNGGYSKEILNSNKTIKLISIDRDKNVIDKANELKEEFGDRFIFVNDTFGNLKHIVRELSLENLVDGIVFDFGVSSMQIDDHERGFSFLRDGDLSMEMGINNISAYDVVNCYPEKKIADIIYLYGEERHSRKIAKKIVERRKKDKIRTTFDLRDVIYSAIGRGRHGKIDNATRTFQAIRIEVNNELEEIRNALGTLNYVLKKNSMLVTLAFHSLEDRIVKQFINGNFNNLSINHNPLVANENPREADFVRVNKKVIRASEYEIGLNPRSSSAKLRVAKYVGEKEL